MTPTLYYYQHCPYCVRVLAFLGMADITVKSVVLLNDDEQTPIDMVGQKMLPILQISTNNYMPESLDIIAYLSETYDFPILENPIWEEQVNTLLTDNRLAIYSLTMPRWIKAPLAEFATQSAIDYFVAKKTATIGDFDSALANTPVFIEDLTKGLADKARLFETLTEQPSSLAAIMLFAGLYGIRYVDGFEWPAAAYRFMTTMAEATNLAL